MFNIILLFLAVISFGAVMVREAIAPLTDWRAMRDARLSKELDLQLSDYARRHPDFPLCDGYKLYQMPCPDWTADDTHPDR